MCLRKFKWEGFWRSYKNLQGRRKGWRFLSPFLLALKNQDQNGSKCERAVVVASIWWWRWRLVSSRKARLEESMKEGRNLHELAWRFEDQSGDPWMFLAEYWERDWEEMCVNYCLVNEWVRVLCKGVVV